ncbi:serine hydroxymethyltransferase [Acidipila sp. EB88]|nr:serine hydroxymethyltransferase [Acidipila sp. EB88]
MTFNQTPRTLAQQDPEIAAALKAEATRQHEGLEMIASENFVSESVLEAAGSVLTNKYAEGYPGKRYYGGCEYADVVETLARERAKRLFGASYVNVQPHSGSQANAAVMMALLEPGDTILGLDLAHGGHLTHGHKLNFSGKLYRVASYAVSRETETIDYDELEQIAERERPKLLIGGGSAYPRQFDFARMRAIADKVGAKLMIDMAHFAGLVAGGVHPSPLPHADVVTTTTHKTLRGPRSGMILAGGDGVGAHGTAVSGATHNAGELQAAELDKLGKLIDRCVFPGQQGGPLMHVVAAKAVAFREALEPGFAGYAALVVRNAQALCRGLEAHGFRLISGGTDTHVVLMDVFERGMLGSEAEAALGAAGITVNKNAIPFDTNPPMKPSGIRLGTPALSTRGMGEAEMEVIAGWIAQALDARADAGKLERIKGEVAELCERFPLYARRRAEEAVEARQPELVRA